MISAALSLTFRAMPGRVVDNTPGLTANQRWSLEMSGTGPFLHRVVRKEHINTEYGSVGHDNAVELGTFPGLQDAGATADVQDWQGQPLEIPKLKMIVVRVELLEPFGPGAAFTDLESNATNPTDGDTLTIGSKTYTFKTTLTPTEGQVLIGGSAAAALLNLSRAILHTGTPGTDYSCAAAHPEVTAAATVETITSTLLSLRITAIEAGTVGNSIVTTTTAATLNFGGSTLYDGVEVASPPVPKPMGGTVTVHLDGGVLPGGATCGSKMVFDKPGFQIVAVDGDWTPEPGSSITVAFDAPVPGLPSEVNAVAAIVLVGASA